jgi:hypothetical protein
MAVQDRKKGTPVGGATGDGRAVGVGRWRRAAIAVAVLAGLVTAPGQAGAHPAQDASLAPICEAPADSPAAGDWVADPRTQADLTAVDQAAQAASAEVVGLIADDQAQSLTVVADAAAPADQVAELQARVEAAAGGTDVEVRLSCRPLDQLQAVQADLASLHQGALEGASYAYEIDPATGTVAVYADDAATAKAINATFGDQVSVTVAGLDRTSGGRTSDASPHYGDARISSGGVTCSSNFSFRNNVFGTRVTATAGHCGGGSWYSGGNLVGSVVYQSVPNPDIEMLYASGQNQTNVIYTDPCSPCTRTVTSKHDPGVNELVCVGGAISLADCGATVMSTNATFCDTWGCTYGLTHAFLLGTTQLCSSGDSGGVVYQREGSSEATANGLIVASVGPGFGGWGCYFHRITQVEATINSTLLTSP